MKTPNLTIIKNNKSDIESISQPIDEDVWAVITDGKLIKFDNAICRKLAAAFDSGNKEPGNEVAKLCALLLDSIAAGVFMEKDSDIFQEYVKTFSIAHDNIADITNEKNNGVEK